MLFYVNTGQTARQIYWLQFQCQLRVGLDFVSRMFVKHEMWESKAVLEMIET